MIIKDPFSWSLINREGIEDYQPLFKSFYLLIGNEIMSTVVSMVDFFKFDRSFSEQDETISLRNILRRRIPQRKF